MGRRAWAVAVAVGREGQRGKQDKWRCAARVHRMFADLVVASEVVRGGLLALAVGRMMGCMVVGLSRCLREGEGEEGIPSWGGAVVARGSWEVMHCAPVVAGRRRTAGCTVRWKLRRCLEYWRIVVEEWDRILPHRCLRQPPMVAASSPDALLVPARLEQLDCRPGVQRVWVTRLAESPG